MRKVATARRCSYHFKMNAETDSDIQVGAMEECDIARTTDEIDSADANDDAEKPSHAVVKSGASGAKCNGWNACSLNNVHLHVEHQNENGTAKKRKLSTGCDTDCRNSDSEPTHSFGSDSSSDSSDTDLSLTTDCSSCVGDSTESGLTHSGIDASSTVSCIHPSHSGPKQKKEGVTQELKASCLDFNTGDTTCSGSNAGHPSDPIQKNSPDEDSEQLHARLTPPEHDLSTIFQSVKDDPSTQINRCEGRRPFACGICDKRFKTRAWVLKHVPLHANGSLPFECLKCGKIFANTYQLKQHDRIHTGEKPYRCKVCGRSFNQTSHVLAHMATHDGTKPHKCDKCHKGFVQKAQLIQHYRIHTGEKPFKCDVCGKRFTQQGNLYNHKKIHEGEKLYNCEQCSKAFMRKGQLASHRRTRTHKMRDESKVKKKRKGKVMVVVIPDTKRAKQGTKRKRKART